MKRLILILIFIILLIFSIPLMAQLGGLPCNLFITANNFNFEELSPNHWWVEWNNYCASPPNHGINLCYYCTALLVWYEDPFGDWIPTGRYYCYNIAPACGDNNLREFEFVTTDPAYGFISGYRYAARLMIYKTNCTTLTVGKTKPLCGTPSIYWTQP